MAITLMPLPYSQDALSPHISAETLAEHHGAHHKGYVDKVNAAIAGTDLADADLETIIKEAGKTNNAKLSNSAGQTWNHGFYWHSLAPAPSRPSPALEAAVERDFGSIDTLLESFSQAAADHFASGWAWIVAEAGRISVTTTHDAGCPVIASAIPLLTIDVWEHAYYLDAKSKRPAYIKAVVGNCLNWDFASQNFASETLWRYPS